MGPATNPPLGAALTAEDLLAEMDVCGIDEALVGSDAIQTAGALEANRRIADQCRPHPRLHPVWHLLPPQTGEMTPETLFDEMAACGVKALKANPGLHRYLLNGITFGALLEPMAARRVPLLSGADWPAVTALLQEFPTLTVIATGLGCWGPDRYFRPLLERFENFHVETSAYEVDGGIKALVDRYGPGRILFGSGYHYRPMGGATLQLRCVDISDEDKALIARGNLQRLLKEMQ